MSEPELIEGTITDFDPEPKKVGAYGNLKQGVRIEPKGGRAEWYSLLDKEPEVKKFREKLAKGAQIKASFVKEEKEGKTYRNLKQVFSVGAPGSVGPAPEAGPNGEELAKVMTECYAQAATVLTPYVAMLGAGYAEELGSTARTLFIERRRGKK